MLDLSWIYSGVDHSLDGNGGPDCVNYLSLLRRGLETSAVCTVATLCIKWGYRRVRLPHFRDAEKSAHVGKQILLVIMCLTFGCEIGFKLATRTAIYLLNPCHVVSLMQIYLLASPHSRIVTAAFRCHIHLLQGAFLALVFPVLNTRLLPMEKEVYFIQHAMILVIPLYLLRIGGVYTMEHPADFSWSVMSAGWSLLYHFVLLQGIGLLTEANLNNMLCPAISDPFRGVNYRIWAFGHQSLLLSCFGKVYFLFCRLALSLGGHTLGHDDIPHDDFITDEMWQEIPETSQPNQPSDPFVEMLKTEDNSASKVRRKACREDGSCNDTRDSVSVPRRQHPGPSEITEEVATENSKAVNGKVNHVD